MHNMQPLFDIKYCTVGTKDEKKCFSITISRTMMAVLIAIMVIIVALSFFVGWGVGGIDTGIKYLALSGIYAFLALILLIPIVGLVILIGFLAGALADSVTLLGIAANVYTSALAAAVFWFGLVGQILVLIHILLKIINSKKSVEQIAAGEF